MEGDVMVEIVEVKDPDFDNEEVDDGFSDEDTELEGSSLNDTEDAFMQQLEMKQKLKSINEELAQSNDHPSRERERRVTFSENLVQYSSKDIEENGANSERSISEEVLDQNIDGFNSQSAIWSVDLAHCFPDSFDDDEDCGDTMLYDGFMDELQRLNLEETNIDPDEESYSWNENVTQKSERTDLDIQGYKEEYDESVDEIRDQFSEELERDKKIEESNEIQRYLNSQPILVEKDGTYDLVPVDSLSDCAGSTPSPITVSEKEKMKKMHLKKKKTDTMVERKEPKIKLPNYQGNSRSAYGMSEEKLRLKKLLDNKKEQKKRIELQKLDENKTFRKEEMEEVFKAWVKKKNEENRTKQKTHLKIKGKLEQNEGKKGATHRAFKKWLRQKKEQKKRELYVERMRREELKQHSYVPDREECDKAFQQWLLSKRMEEKLEELRFSIKYNRRRKNLNLLRSLPAPNLNKTAKTYFDYTV